MSVRIFLLLFLITSLSFSMAVKATPYSNSIFHKFIFGEDDRVDIFDAPIELQALSRAVAVKVFKDKINFSDDGEIATLVGPLLSEGLTRVCSDENFSDQIKIGSCSGFLVAPDILVTAGHCVPHQADCDYAQWVFDFHQDKIDPGNVITVPGENVYKCQEIITSNYDYHQKDPKDYAVIRLDRPVLDRMPLPVNMLGSLSFLDKLALIGHPSGLPLKVVPNGLLMDNSDPFIFKTTLDAFAGNSGGPVINMRTWRVEGILIRGAEDYYYDKNNNCARSIVCEDDCPGEEVLRMSVISELNDLL